MGRFANRLLLAEKMYQAQGAQNLRPKNHRQLEKAQIMRHKNLSKNLQKAMMKKRKKRARQKR